MSTQPNQGNNPDPNYGGYAGYRPRKPAEDPYGAYYQPGGNQQGSSADTVGQQQSDPNYVYGQQPQQGQQYSAGSQQQQQQQAYQPPSSVSSKQSYGKSSQTSTGLQPNHAAFFSYLGICFTGLIFFFLERKNRLVRFSAAQSIVLFFPLLVAYGLIQFLIGLIAPIWLIGPLLGFFLGAATLVLIVVPGVALWLYLMFQAYRGVEVKLPFVSQYAEKLLNLFSPKQKTI